MTAWRKRHGFIIMGISSMKRIIAKILQKYSLPDYKFGLFLALSGIVTLFLLWLAIEFIKLILNIDFLGRSDLTILAFIKNIRGGLLDQIMLFITYLGQWPVMLFAATALGIFLVLVKKWRHLTILLTSVLGGELFVWILKHIVAKPRPPIANALVYQSDFSFPSGHTFVAFSFYGLAVYFLSRWTPRPLYKFLALAGGLILIIIISFSRIYLIVHWPSDVFETFIFGTVWLVLMISVSEIRDQIQPPVVTKPFLIKPLLAISALTLIFSFLLFSFFYYKTHPVIPLEPGDNQIQFFASYG